MLACQRGTAASTHLAGRCAVPAQHAQQAAGQHARRQPHQHPARCQLQAGQVQFSYNICEGCIGAASCTAECMQIDSRCALPAQFPAPAAAAQKAARPRRRRCPHQAGLRPGGGTAQTAQCLQQWHLTWGQQLWGASWQRVCCRLAPGAQATPCLPLCPPASLLPCLPTHPPTQPT